MGLVLVVVLCVAGCVGVCAVLGAGWWLNGGGVLLVTFLCFVVVGGGKV